MQKSKLWCSLHSHFLYKKRYDGFTLIEALVLLFIFSLITVTFYQVMSVGTAYMVDSKNRLTALAIANEKMEAVRNLKYDNVGTIGGNADGSIPPEENVTVGGRTYNIDNAVEYVDDPLDGVYPADAVFEDYKKVTIKVAWINGANTEEVKLVSRFVPAGLEVLNPGDGVLFVNVFSDPPDAQPISGATVHVENDETNLIDTETTGDDGQVIFMGSKVTDSVQKYKIKVSKTGYETVETLPHDYSDYQPKFVHGSVETNTGIPNVSNIIQNKLGNLKITTEDYLGQPVPDISFHITGGKIIGNLWTFPNDPVYNLNEDGSTNSEGVKEYGPVSPSNGSYTFTLSSSVTDYELIYTDPPSPFVLFPEQSIDFKVRLASKTAPSLLVKVISSGDSAPVSGAQVTLTNGSDYTANQDTLYNGAAFFPITADPLIPDDYTVEVSADGYSNKEIQTTISVNELKEETIDLTAEP